MLKSDAVWYCLALLRSSISSMTDTGSRSFDCALISVMERHKERLASGSYLIVYNYWAYIESYLSYLSCWNYLTHLCVDSAWLECLGSRVLYDLDPKKACIIRSSSRVYSWKDLSGPCWIFLGGAHDMRAKFSGAPADRTPGSGDSCPVWYVNSWALGWSRKTCQ